MNKIEKECLKLVINEINGQTTNNIECNDYKAIFQFALKHGIDGLLYAACLRSKILLPDDIEKKIKKRYLVAENTYIMQSALIDQIRNDFEKKKINTLFLKGSVIRKLYNNPALRRCADVDFIASDYDVEFLNKYFENNGYNLIRHSSNVLEYENKPFMTVEVHKNLFDESYKYQFDVNLSSLESVNEYKYSKILSNEFIYLHSIVHIANHLLTSGIGVRHFIDIWLMLNSQKFVFNQQIVNDELCKLGLLEFNQKVIDACNYMFNNEKPNDDIEEFVKYILYIGNFGNTETKVINKLSDKSKIEYLKNRLFPSYDQLKIRYKQLDGKKILLPYFWVLRLFSLINPNRKKRISKELRATINNKTEEIFDVNSIFSSIGL